MHSVHARITGRVQGVGYRAWTVETATRLGLSGWVRNRLDGSVEAVFQGEDLALRQMENECRKGPLLAKVFDIRLDTIDPDPSLTGFSPKPTA